MRILLTNDDGIYAPGLAALENELRKMGEVTVVAPAFEQSGVGHSITFLTPLVVREVFDGDRRRGWACEGSPADSVKLGITELCDERPDLIVSGINGGLNAGINVLYSGTVAAAIEGAFFGLTSIAVSLEYAEHPDWPHAAQLSCEVIRKILERKGPQPQLYNLNIPTVALHRATQVRVVPMGVVRYGEKFERRLDPRGRCYYWATSDPPPPLEEQENDLSSLAQGYVTLTPLHFDLTRHAAMQEMGSWNLMFNDQSRTPSPGR